MATVLYIGGCTRSGSTLVDRMLGQVPGVLSTGEFGLMTTHSLVENRLCGCGLRFSECGFWQEVGRRAFGGWESDEARELVRLHPTLTRQRQIPLLVVPGLSPAFRRRLERYRELLSRLYAAAAEVGEASVIVDSTKAPAYAFVLRGVPGVDMRTLHLVRDSRGTAFSSSKVQIMQDSVDRVVYKHRYPALVITLRWIAYHLLFDYLAAVDRKTLVSRYEDIVRDPRGSVRRILAFLGREVRDEELAFAEPDSVELRVDHTAVGNDMRFRHGRIALREDDQWKTSFDARSRRTVTVLSWPLLKRWRYT
ncbi:MAG: sulfotransferase family protein [Candidatus Dormibacterales bacterium]